MSNDSVSPVYGVRKSSLLNLAGKYNLPSPSLNSDPAKVLLATSTSAPPLPFSTPPISPDKLPLHSSSTPPPSYFSPQSKHSTAQSKTPPSNPSAKTSPIPVINVRPAPDQISSQLLFPSPIRLQPSSADQGQNLSEPKNPPAASKYDIFLPPLAEKQPAGNNNAITKKKETDSDGGVSQREVVPVDERVKKNPKDWHFFISCRSTSDIPACLALKKELLNIAKDSTKCSFAIKVYIHMPQHIRNNYKSKTAKPSHQPPKPATPLKPTSAPQSPIIRKPNKQSTQVFISVSSLFDSDPEPNDAENSDLKRVDEDEFLLSESEEFNTMQVLNGTCCFIPVISSDCLDGLSGLKNGFEDEDFVLWLMALELSSTNDLSILPFFVGDQPSSHDEEYVEFNAYQKLKTLPETYGLYSCNVTVKDCILGLIISRKSGKKTSQKQDTQISGFLYNPATVTKASLDIFNSLVDEHMEIYADMWTDPATLLPWYHYQVTTHKSPFAQYFMAQSYEKGLYGLRKDAAIAFSLYQVIAEQSIESSGSGTSYTTAVLSMTKLSKVYVKYGLALMYGKGTTVNVEAAIPWLHRAGEMGEGKAALQLGECYLNGMGVRKSETEALKWFSVAAEKGEPAALNNLGACYRYGIGVPNGVPDLAYALELFERAAKVYGFVPAMFNFATSLEAGRGTVDGVPDYEGAAEWYFKAATTLPQPEVRAYTALGKLYLQGYGVAKNQVRAVDCFMKAFRGEGREDGKGDMMAGFYLGMCYMNGEGVDKDYAVAMEWFKRGELQGNPDSVCAIGEMYEQGLGVPVDINTAVSYYKRSIGMGSINGKYNLAMCYFSDHDGQLLAHNQPPPQSTKHYSYLLGNSGEYDHQRRASDTSLSSTTKPKPSGIKKAASFLSFGGGGGKKKESQPVQKVEQVPQHDLYGFSLLSEAAREGHVKACFEMGKCYQNGVRGAQRDRILAIDWYRKARDGGDKRADFVLKNWMN